MDLIFAPESSNSRLIFEIRSAGVRRRSAWIMRRHDSAPRAPSRTHTAPADRAVVPLDAGPGRVHVGIGVSPARQCAAGSLMRRWSAYHGADADFLSAAARHPAARAR